MALYYTSQGVRVNTSYLQTFQSKSGEIALVEDLEALREEVEALCEELQNSVNETISNIDTSNGILYMWSVPDDDDTSYTSSTLNLDSIDVGEVGFWHFHRAYTRVILPAEGTYLVAYTNRTWNLDVANPTHGDTLTLYSLDVYPNQTIYSGGTQILRTSYSHSSDEGTSFTRCSAGIYYRLT